MIQKKLFLRIILLSVLFSLFAWSFSGTLQAQTSTQQNNGKSIKGIVTDENGTTLPGVKVNIEGSNKSVATDINGQFNIALPDGSSRITFSFIGYLSKTLNISALDSRSLNVKLLPDNKQLDEVVVVGYGTQRAKDLTGNISVVNSHDFEKAPVTNAEALIANKISGVQVLPFSGKPGSGSSFLIQGGASLNATNDPLIVIDGLPIEGWNNGPGMLSQLNPADIESFTVLKDASASAIYGSRASNGVILITTKKGDKGSMKVDFTSNFRLSSLRKKTPVLSADQYRALATELGSKVVVTPGNANTDWQNAIFQNAFAHDYNVSLTGSIKRLPYRISLGYTNQDGILKTGNYERSTASLGVNPSFLKDHLKLNINIKGSYENERIANTSAIWSAISFDPTQPIYVDDQTYGGYFQYDKYKSNPALTNINPLSMLHQVNDRNRNLRSLGNIQADYSFHFLPDLHLNVNAGYDISQGKYTYLTDSKYFAEILSDGKLYKEDPSRRTKNLIFESYLFYKKELPSIKSKLDLTAGYSFNDFSTKKYFYPSYSANGEKLAGSDPNFPFDIQSHSIVSFYGRLNYSFLEKYLLTASIRDDASSRFAEKHRWGLFPSMALAWKIKEESFLKNVKTVSDLKLRIGYGVTGQQDGLPNYYPIKRYTTSGATYKYTFGNNEYFTVFPQIYNPDLKWEETATANIGIDYALFNYRLTGTLNFYNKKTKDLLNSITIPYGFSFGSTMTRNIGTMENKGVEFNIKAVPVETKEMSWDISFNATYNQNKITKISLEDKKGVGLFSDAILVNTVGQPRSTYYLYHQIYDKNGMPVEDQMLDVVKDGLMNANDRYITGKSSIPKYLLGLSTNFRYKNMSAGASFHSNIGHYIFYMPSENTVALTNWNTSQNLNVSYYKSLFHNIDQYEGYSDYYLQNASFLKMDNFYVGYDFGKVFRSKSLSLKANISVQNVFTITKYTGLDPETNSGYENSYPVPRVFALGINLNF